MTIILLLIVTYLNIAAASQTVAVLEFRGVGVDNAVLLKLSDSARVAARNALPSTEYDLMTRENVVQAIEVQIAGASEASVSTERTRQPKNGVYELNFGATGSSPWDLEHLARLEKRIEAESQGRINVTIDFGPRHCGTENEMIQDLSTGTQLQGGIF